MPSINNRQSLLEMSAIAANLHILGYDTNTCELFVYNNGFPDVWNPIDKKDQADWLKNKLNFCLYVRRTVKNRYLETVCQPFLSVRQFVEASSDPTKDFCLAIVKCAADLTLQVRKCSEQIP